MREEGLRQGGVPRRTRPMPALPSAFALLDAVLVACYRPFCLAWREVPIHFLTPAHQRRKVPP
jgi:hypothetical protein